MRRDDSCLPQSPMIRSTPFRQSSGVAAPGKRQGPLGAGANPCRTGRSPFSGSWGLPAVGFADSARRWHGAGSASDEARAARFRLPAARVAEALDMAGRSGPGPVSGRTGPNAQTDRRASAFRLERKARGRVTQAPAPQATRCDHPRRRGAVSECAARPGQDGEPPVNVRAFLRLAVAPIGGQAWPERQRHKRGTQQARGILRRRRLNRARDADRGALAPATTPKRRIP